MKKTLRHPVLSDFEITFDSRYHTYRDSDGQKYKSVTEVVSECFEPFDAQAAANRIAKRENRLAMEVLAGWKAKGTAASEFGNHVHAYAEILLRRHLGEDLLMVDSSPDPKWPAAKKAVDYAVEMIVAEYDILAVEYIVFDPLYCIAGQVDILARHRGTGLLTVADWKTCEKIESQNYGKFGLPPFESVPDSKWDRYRLQLSEYAFIIRDTGCEPEDAPIAAALVHIPPFSPDPKWMPISVDFVSAAKIATQQPVDFPGK